MTRSSTHQAAIDLWNQTQRASSQARAERADLERYTTAELDTFGRLEGDYEELYLLHYRDRKVCRLCKTYLPLDAFHRHQATRDGLKPECNRCHYDRYCRPKLALLNERAKAWARANPEAVKASRRKQARRPEVRVRNRLMGRLKRLVGSKSERTNELIGCTPKALVTHLESQFQPGMSWDTYGQWHIDHIIPCRAFDLTVKEERLRCFHWTNMRPLWAAENTSKSDLLPDGSRARDLVL